MSFDLYFASQSRKNEVADQILPLLDGGACWKEHKRPNGSTWAYENEPTGVYFTLDVVSGETGYQDALPDGLHDVGIEMNVNYYRPTFFAMEALPWAIRIAEAADLEVFDPQAERCVPRGSAMLSALTDSWRNGNRKAIQIGVGESVYWPLQRSIEWWQYQSTKESTQAQLGENVFVPTIALLRDPSVGIKTAITWADGIPMLFPDCELTILVQSKKRWFSSKKSFEMRVLPTTQVRTRLRACLVDEATPSGIIDRVAPNKLAEVEQAFAELVPLGIPLNMKGIRPDEFVDEPVPQK